MERQLAAWLYVRGMAGNQFLSAGSRFWRQLYGCYERLGDSGLRINFADKPFDWLQLGYASFLSSWCLMNTDTPETNYGHWFPGKENDVAPGRVVAAFWIISGPRLLPPYEFGWIISGPRLVQTQAALNEVVYVIPRIQGSEAFVLRSGRLKGKRGRL